MPKIDPFAARLLAIVAVPVALFGWLRAGQVELLERMARLEGAAAGAPGRPFPGANRLAGAPGAGMEARGAGR